MVTGFSHHVIVLLAVNMNLEIRKKLELCPFGTGCKFHTLILVYMYILLVGNLRCCVVTESAIDIADSPAPPTTTTTHDIIMEQ